MSEWRFNGTPWEFINLVRHACVVYECVRKKRKDVLDVLTNDAVFQKTAEEYGITYDVVKSEMHNMLDFADWLEKNKIWKIILANNKFIKITKGIKSW